MRYLKNTLVALAFLGLFFVLSKTNAQASSVNWTTPQVTLSASDLSITTNGTTFNPSNTSIHSDPGTPSYTTLEATWYEQGVEMRLYMYLGVDNGQWKVTEIRTYNGQVNGDWLYYPGFTGGSLGSAYNGNLDLNSTSGGTGVLHFSNLHLQPSFVTQDYAIRVTSPNGGESVSAGQSMQVRWTFLNPGRTDTQQTFGTSIYLQKDGNTVATLINNQNITRFNDNSISVTMPDVSSGNYKIRVYMNTPFSTANGEQNLSDTSDNTFTIVGKPSPTNTPIPTNTPVPTSPSQVVKKGVYITPTATPTPKQKSFFGDFLNKKSDLADQKAATPSSHPAKNELKSQNIFERFLTWFHSFFLHN